MSRCRIARRVASFKTARISPNYAVLALTLATKVLRYRVPLFPCRGAGRERLSVPVSRCCRLAVRLSCRALPSPRVGSVGGSGLRRRVAQARGAGVTPLNLLALSTKERTKGGSA